MEEALIEMYLAGISVRRVEDITEALWVSKVSPATISELNKKAYVHIEDWRARPLRGGRCPYVYVDGIYLRRNWGGEYENVAVADMLRGPFKPHEYGLVILPMTVVKRFHDCLPVSYTHLP